MSVLFFLIGALVVLYFNMTTTLSAVVLAVVTLAGIIVGGWSILGVLFGVILLALTCILIFPNSLRLNSISAPLLNWVRGLLPTLSDTEAEALKSGSVDWDGELFSGKPQWNKLLASVPAKLTEEEQAFLDGPVEELCLMVDDWKLTHEDFDLPDEVWAFIRKNGFFGLMIPKDKGGKGFSHSAHSEIVMKLSTRSVSTSVTVMVPNSLGPGELLMEYGTEKQKDYYLPRLAKGEETPCFALTSPVAGSDAGAIPDKGIVCRGEWKGKETLGLKITWNKRYITLAPVATLIGLAIKVYDPDEILGDTPDIGVTCVLVPADLEGVNSGTRHLPMNTVFMNGPTWGTEVFIPMEQVIGGQDMLGKGWTMLLECLSIGRSISLPALATGGGKVACLATGSYSFTREQFGRSISRFEGVQEALEPIAGYTYMMDAARVLTSGMLDRGVRPAVLSAVLKYRNTDLMRKAVNHAMDVVAGRAVITGPRNFLARSYQAIPIGITVEGANILTRSLMIFGQGAIRCHPFIVEEIEAAGLEDQKEGVKKFDGVFYKHIAHTSRNAVRALIAGLTNAWLEPAPSQGNIGKYYKQLGRFSAAYALMTDVSLLSVGGGLKARQRLSGRMADCLTHLYYASAVIKYWHEEGYPEEHRPIVEWCLQTCLRDLKKDFRELIINYPVPALRWPLRVLVFPLGATGLNGPNDKLGTEVAMTIVKDTPMRKTLSRGCYVNPDAQDSLGRILNAYRLANETKEVRNKLHTAVRARDPDDLDGIALLMAHERKMLVDWAVEEKVVTKDESKKLLEALTALYDVLRVDAFEAEGIKELAAGAQGKRQVVERIPHK